MFSHFILISCKLFMETHTSDQSIDVRSMNLEHATEAE